MKPLRITVTGAGSLLGQAILKSLRHESNSVACKIQGFDYFDDAWGFRWCAETALLPDILSPKLTEDEWIDALCKRLSEFDSQYLLPGLDFELIPLASRKDEIQRRTGCRVIVSRPELVETCRDKYKTFAMLQSQGFDVPDSIAEAVSYTDLVKRLGTPFVVKPRIGSRSRGFSVVRTEQQFGRALEECALPVFQEYLTDDAMEFSVGVNVLGGQVDTVCVLRRKLKDGNTASASSARNAAVEDYCRGIASNLLPDGPLNIQLRVQSGVPKTFEINPRFSGTTYFRTLLGVNEVSRLLGFHEGHRLPEAPRLNDGTVRRFFDETIVRVGT